MTDPNGDTIAPPDHDKVDNASLKRQLLGPSVLKSGQDNVDQTKVSEIIYEASKGSKYFKNEERRDKNLTDRIERILKKKEELERLDITSDVRRADNYIAKRELERDLSQTVIHVDCDAFYASVEELDHPEYKTLPMAVGKGVLTTCNYLARKFGCRSGMAGHIAKKLCPQLICLPLNFEKYGAKAQEVREVLVKYDARFEAASVDEAYLNITKYLEEHDLDADQVVEQIRNEVEEHSKVTISAGIAPNARLAKIASNINKPNGQFKIPSDRSAVMEFMRTLPVRKVNGVGRVFERELEAVGIKTCGDIYPMRGYITKLFGEKAFDFLIDCMLGLGRTDIKPAGEYIRKSIGTESTFRDLSGTTGLREKLMKTAESLEEDLAKHQLSGRVLHLKIKQHNYLETIRQRPLPRAIWKATDLYEYALPMLTTLEKELKPLTLRLMGLRLTGLASLKKIDSLDDFFKVPVGAKKLKQSTEDQWETWPEDEWTKYDSDGHEIGRADSDSPFKPDYNTDTEISELKVSEEIQKKKEDGPQMEVPAEKEEWSCPICSRPQPANDQLFNQHVDFCLSRQTILEAVQETSNIPPPETKAVEQQQRNKSPEKTGLNWMIRDSKENKVLPRPKSTRGRPRKRPRMG